MRERKPVTIMNDMPNNLTEYAIELPEITSLPIAGSALRFPIRRVYCLARNYAAHAVEMGSDPKKPPFYFEKPASAICSAQEDFTYPEMSQALSYETELFVALKSGGKNIDEAEANAHIFGYGVAQDMTLRDLQTISKAERQPWEPAKSFDNSAPCTAVHPVAKTGLLTEARIWLSVNGVIKQESNINKMIWKIPKIIAELSRHNALKAGDIILTGTPKGVDVLRREDVLRAGIDGLDEMTFKVV